MRRPPLQSTPIRFRPTGITEASIRREIDLRTEFDNIILGADGGIKHGYPILIRRMRRDSENRGVPCECVKETTGMQGNPTCPYCLGEGILWDEVWTIGRAQYLGPEGGRANKWIRMPPGQIRAEYKVFFLRYDANVRDGDKIIEVLLDEEGKVILNSTTNAFIRENIYKPQTIDRLRSDNGRIEYLAVYCAEYDAIRNDNPVR